MISVVTVPAAVDPRSDDQGVEYPGIVLVDRMECAEWTLQIFGIEPSTDGEHSAVNVLHVRRQVAHLPVIVVGIMAHLVVVEETLAVKVFRKIADRA